MIRLRAHERAIRAWQTYAEGLRVALLDERRNHARTQRLLEEATEALGAGPPTPRDVRVPRRVHPHPLSGHHGRLRGQLAHSGGDLP